MAGGEEETPEYLRNPEMEMPVEEIEGNGYIGLLEIPALGLSLPVMSEWSYPNLKLAPCRYSGSAYTGISPSPATITSTQLWPHRGTERREFHHLHRYAGEPFFL